jgi:hypothetical protein
MTLSQRRQRKTHHGAMEQVSASFVEFFRLLIAAILSAWLSGYLVRRWQYREDHVNRRADDLINEIGTLRDLCIDYWLIDSPSEQADMNRGRVLQEALEKNGAKIIALQHQIAALRSSLVSDFSSDYMSTLDQAEASLFDATTGGEFGVSSRNAEPARVRIIAGAAAAYINSVRSARNRHLSRRSIFFFGR